MKKSFVVSVLLEELGVRGGKEAGRRKRRKKGRREGGRGEGRRKGLKRLRQHSSNICEKTSLIGQLWTLVRRFNVDQLIPGPRTPCTRDLQSCACVTSVSSL